jgi:hypothetical protein
MRNTSYVIALVCILAFLAGGVCAQEKKPAATKPETAKIESMKPAPGKIAVEEDILLVFVDEPTHHFGLARDSFMKHDYKTSASEIRKGAGYLKLEMGRATTEGQRALYDAVVNLSKLSDEVEQGTVTSVDKLDKVFAHAEQALAFHHELKAKEYWAAQDHKKAGQDLKAASMHLENSMKYSGEKVETATQNTIKDAHDMGQKLVEGTGYVADKVGKAMQDLGKKIEEAGKKMMAPKK